MLIWGNKGEEGARIARQEELLMLKAICIVCVNTIIVVDALIYIFFGG